MCVLSAIGIIHANVTAFSRTRYLNLCTFVLQIFILVCNEKRDEIQIDSSKATDKRTNLRKGARNFLARSLQLNVVASQIIKEAN